jgi:hypothetical protein
VLTFYIAFLLYGDGIKSRTYFILGWYANHKTSGSAVFVVNHVSSDFEIVELTTDITKSSVEVKFLFNLILKYVFI